MHERLNVRQAGKISAGAFTLSSDIGLARDYFAIRLKDASKPTMAFY
jgi:hypothetical protein